MWEGLNAPIYAQKHDDYRIQESELADLTQEELGSTGTSTSTEATEFAVSYKWVIDPGDFPLQRGLEAAGLEEADWKAANTETRRALLAGATTVVALQQAMRHAVKPVGPTTAEAAEVPKNAAWLLRTLGEALSDAMTSQKQPGYKLNRALVAPIYKRERDTLIGLLESVRVAVEKSRNLASVPAEALAADINKGLVRRLGHSLLRVERSNILALRERTATDVATEILKTPGRFRQDLLKTETKSAVRIRNRRKKVGKM